MVSHPLRIKCQHLIADLKTVVGPLLAFPSTTLPAGPAPHGQPSVPSSEPLCLLGGFLQKVAKLISLFSVSDLRSLSKATLTTWLKDLIHPSFFLLHHLIAGTLKSLPASAVVSVCHLFTCFCRNLFSFRRCTPRMWKVLSGCELSEYNKQPNST